MDSVKIYALEISCYKNVYIYINISLTLEVDLLVSLFNGHVLSNQDID